MPSRLAHVRGSTAPASADFSAEVPEIAQSASWRVKLSITHTSTPIALSMAVNWLLNGNAIDIALGGDLHDDVDSRLRTWERPWFVRHQPRAGQCAERLFRPHPGGRNLRNHSPGRKTDGIGGSSEAPEHELSIW